MCLSAIFQNQDCWRCRQDWLLFGAQSLAEGRLQDILYSLLRQLILVNSNLVGKNRDTLKYLKCKVHNDIPGMKTESGDRQGYPLRTFSSGIYLNGFSDHFPTQIFLVREVKMPKK